MPYPFAERTLAGYGSTGLLPDTTQTGRTMRKAEAIRYAESCQSPWASDRDIDGLCEEILLSSGLVRQRSSPS